MVTLVYDQGSEDPNVHIQYRQNTRCAHRKCNPSKPTSNNNANDTKYTDKRIKTCKQTDTTRQIPKAANDTLLLAL